MKDEYGFDSGDGFGTTAPGLDWSNFGYYDSAREAKSALSMVCAPGVSYRIHPRNTSCVQWRLI
jgi:hypothetical protein